MTDRPILFSAPMVRALLNGSKTQTRRVLKPQPPEGTRALFGPEMYAPAVVDKDGELQAGADVFGVYTDDGEWGARVPYQPGDRLWVREDHWRYGSWAPLEGVKTKGGAQKWAFFPAPRALFEPPPGARSGLRKSDPAPGWYKRLGRFMPRALSRTTLIVEGVKVERLQDISEADAIAEGATNKPNCSGYASRYDGWSMNWREPASDHSLATPESAFASFINELHGGPNWNVKNERSLWAENPWVVAVTFRVVRGNIDTIGAAP